MYTTYQIKRSHHYLYHHIFRWPFHHGKRLLFNAIFKADCLYDVSITGDDINKLYGICDNWSTVHRNSARFGWRHDGKGKIEIFAYWYVNGIRYYIRMGDTEPSLINTYEILIESHTYCFKFNDNILSIPRYKRDNFGIKFRFFPYFGGDHVDPQTSTILIEELK